MIFQEVNWIRSNNKKLCPALRKAALDWYRPIKHMPCFFQKPLKQFRQRFKKIPVIVQTEEGFHTAVAIQSLASAAGCRIQKELPSIRSFSAKVNANSLEQLVQDPSIKKVWLDREVKAVLDIASPVVGAASLWQTGITGKGVTVAVLDTGIYNHPDLAGRITGFKDFVNQKAAPYDDNGHGTHVAGDIAANGSESNSQYRGPAPEASVVGVKVLNKMGSGTLSTVIEGIQWCIDQKDVLGIQVISMSLGSEAAQSYTDDPVCMAVEKAWKAGIVVCVAAGNSGPELSTISSPGIDPLVITVGALDDNNTMNPGDDKAADFSSRGPVHDPVEGEYMKPDVLAPGVNIISLRSPNSLLDKQNKQARVGNWYFSLSGTSMATPVCSGVVAQMLQYNSSLTPDEIKIRLMNTGRILPDTPVTTQGSGLINGYKALGLP